MRAIDANLQYECLARFLHRLAQMRGRTDPNDFTLHKPLRSVPGMVRGKAGARALNAWLGDRVLAPLPARVLDLGCGFGATLMTFAGRHAAEYHGISASAFQVETARRLSARAPHEARIRFSCGDFEEADLGSGYDAVVAVESIGYARDLSAMARRLRGILEPGGRLYLIDDWKVRGAAMTPEEAGFLRLWGRPRLPSVDELMEAMRAAGFEVVDEVDLTAHVPGVACPPARFRFVLLRLLSSLPWGRGTRAVLAAYLGGCYLERLYAHGLVRYRYTAFRLPAP